MKPLLSSVLSILICMIIISAPASAQYGSISGVVTESGTGLPIPAAQVGAINMDDMTTGETFTDSAGFYFIDSLSPGQHIVGATKDGYEENVYPGLVNVEPGMHYPDIDITLTFVGGTGIGSISGTVTDAETGLPIDSASISVSGVFRTFHTGSDGTYLCDSIPDGTYKVTAYTSGYFAQVYPESVTVAIDEDTPNIDFALTPLGEYGSISGLITDAVTGEPAANIYVSAYGALSSGGMWTDSTGQYMIPDLYAGNYIVSTWSEYYWDEEYPDSVYVASGENTPGIDFDLVPHGGPDDGIIAGTVLEEGTLTPIEFGLVIAVTADEAEFGGAFTDSTGTYTIMGLPSAEYYVFVFTQSHIGEFYDNVYTWEEATPLIPDQYGIDFLLAPCDTGDGMVSGIISDDGIPVEDATVLARRSGEVRATTTSDSDGSYTLYGLMPGSYEISASKVLHLGASYPTQIEVGTGEVNGIDIELQAMKNGDCTLDGTVDVDDAVFLISYIFSNGPAPSPLHMADSDCSGGVDIDDVVWIIAYAFSGGYAPGDTNGDGIPDC